MRLSLTTFKQRLLMTRRDFRVCKVIDSVGDIMNCNDPKKDKIKDLKELRDYIGSVIEYVERCQ